MMVLPQDHHVPLLYCVVFNLFAWSILLVWRMLLIVAYWWWTDVRNRWSWTI